MYFINMARWLIDLCAPLHVLCVFANPQGFKAPTHTRGSGYHARARGPVKSIDKRMLKFSVVAQQKTQANTRRTKMAPPKLEIHGRKTCHGLRVNASHCTIPRTTDCFKMQGGQRKSETRRGYFEKIVPNNHNRQSFPGLLSRIEFMLIYPTSIKFNNIGRP